MADCTGTMTSAKISVFRSEAKKVSLPNNRVKLSKPMNLAGCGEINRALVKASPKVSRINPARRPPTSASTAPVYVNGPFADSTTAPLIPSFNPAEAPAAVRIARVATTQDGTLEQIVLGPAQENDGTFNLMGALRTSMATTGYENIAEFHRAEVMVAPALQSEG